jgi:hypothetical protein
MYNLGEWVFSFSNILCDLSSYLELQSMCVAIRPEKERDQLSKIL